MANLSSSTPAALAHYAQARLYLKQKGIKSGSIFATWHTKKKAIRLKLYGVRPGVVKLEGGATCTVYGHLRTLGFVDVTSPNRRLLSYEVFINDDGVIMPEVPSWLLAVQGLTPDCKLQRQSVSKAKLPIQHWADWTCKVNVKMSLTQLALVQVLWEALPDYLQHKVAREVGFTDLLQLHAVGGHLVRHVKAVRASPGKPGQVHSFA